MKNTDMAYVMSRFDIYYPDDFEERLRQISVSEESKGFCEFIINRLNDLKKLDNSGKVKVSSVVEIFITTITNIYRSYEPTPPYTLYQKTPYKQLLELTDVTPSYLKVLIESWTCLEMAVYYFTEEMEEIRSIFEMNLENYD